VRLEPHATIAEKEPNNRQQPQRVEVPVTITGRIAQPGEVDVYEFTLKKGQKVSVVIESRTLDFPLDPVLRLTDGSGKLLTQAQAKKLGTDAAGREKWGPAGVAVWSTVGLDPAANRIYFSTGNQYSGDDTPLVDSIVALTLDTGKLVWSHAARPSDVFVIGCRDCGPDYDFGTTPFTFRGPGGKLLVGAGQKSGWFHALERETGKPAWSTEVGKGGALGGIEFGTATDGERVFAAQAHRQDGAVAMLDGATGKVIWRTATPDKTPNYGPLIVTGRGDDRLVFAGSAGGFIRAYDARDGKVLWEFDTAGGIGGGPAVSGGVLYVGSGYTFLRVGKPNNKLYAFSLDGQ